MQLSSNRIDDDAAVSPFFFPDDRKVSLCRRTGFWLSHDGPGRVWWISAFGVIT